MCKIGQFPRSLLHANHLKRWDLATMNSTNQAFSEVTAATFAGADSKPSSQGWPEPSPDWSDQGLGHWAWKLHTYGFAGFYLIFALDGVWLLIREWKLYSRSKLHVRFLNLELLFTSLVRGFVLLFDPYGTRDLGKAWSLFTLILWGLATASVISAFSILLLILLDTTQMSLGPPRLQKLSVLLSITALNCAFFIAANTAAFFVVDIKTIIFACRFLFVLWGLTFCVGYAMTCSRIRRNLNSSRHFAVNDRGFAQETARMKKVLFLMCLASVAGGAMFGLSLFVAVYGPLAAGRQSSFMGFWPWYGTQTTLRVLELMIMFLISGMALRAKKRNSRRVTEQSANALEMRARCTLSSFSATPGDLGAELTTPRTTSHQSQVN